MKIMVDYQLEKFSNCSFEKIKEKIKGFIDTGWEPIGTMQITGSSDDRYNVIQAFGRFEEQKEQTINQRRIANGEE